MPLTPLRFLTGPVVATRAQASAAFAKVLARELGHPVDVRPTPSYGELLESVIDGDAAFAWLPPAVLVRAEALGGAVPLVAGIRAREAVFRGAFFVRDANPVGKLEALEGRRVAWVDRNSCAGYLFPRRLLAKAGFDPEGFFGEQRLLGTHGAVVDAVERAEVDVGATFLHQEGDDARVVGSGWSVSRSSEPMRVVAMTDPIPADALAALGQTPPELRARFTETLTTLHQLDDGRRALHRLFGVERFEATGSAHYDAVREAMDTAS